MLTKAFIPYRGYYSTPFVRWQGSLANEHSILLGANTSRRFFAARGWDPAIFDYVLVGSTVYQKQWFYSGPWAAAVMGAAGVPGGQAIAEDWVMDNFGKDPWAGGPMIQTAENVSKEYGVTREECDAIVLMRQEQYRDSLANDREFQKRYLFPVEVQLSKKKTVTVEADEGVPSSGKEGLAALRPLLPEGVHTFGSQTYPADGNCGLCVTTREKAKELSADNGVEVRIVSFGYARTKKGFMAAAVAPSAPQALDNAGIQVKDLAAVKTHNPFASNDAVLSKVLGVP